MWALFLNESFLYGCLHSNFDIGQHCTCKSSGRWCVQVLILNTAAPFCPVHIFIHLHGLMLMSFSVCYSGAHFWIYNPWDTVIYIYAPVFFSCANCFHCYTREKPFWHCGFVVHSCLHGMWMRQWTYWCCIYSQVLLQHIKHHWQSVFIDSAKKETWKWGVLSQVKLKRKKLLALTSACSRSQVKEKKWPWWIRGICCSGLFTESISSFETLNQMY